MRNNFHPEPKRAEQVGTPHPGFRVLVVVGRLLEGFDHSPISVVGIARNVKSRVLFEQFVGRAVRFTGTGDIATAYLITHGQFKQRENFDLIDVTTNQDPEEEDDDLVGAQPLEEGHLRHDRAW